MWTYVLKTTLLLKLTPLLRDYPDIVFDTNHGFRDIVADRFDAGVRRPSDATRSDATLLY